MEEALYINNPKQLRDLSGLSRIYYGAEFCENKIPDLNKIKRVFSLVKKSHKKFTFLIPYMTNSGLSRIPPLLEYLDAQDDDVEVIFNDWGVFKLIRERFKRIKPILGRLLTKQRRDPRAYIILLNRQKAKRVIDQKAKKTFIIIPKKVPSSLYKHFKASVINVPIFQRFLLDNGIRRVEIDNLVWDMKIKIPKEMGVSVYLPYAYVTTTRLCGLINLTYTACKKECQRYYLSFKSDLSSVPFYIRGNTVFYKSEIPGERYLKQRNIDRIVWEPGVPV